MCGKEVETAEEDMGREREREREREKQRDQGSHSGVRYYKNSAGIMKTMIGEIHWLLRSSNGHLDLRISKVHAIGSRGTFYYKNIF